MKLAQAGVGAIVLALFSAVDVRAQNVGIGVSNPQSKLTVNGNLAIGADYNVAAPTNGALIEGNTGIGVTAPQARLHVDGSELVAPGGVTGAFWNGTANTDGTEIDLFGLIGTQRSAGAGLCVSKPATYTNTWLEQFVFNGTAIGVITVNASANPTGVIYGQTSDLRLKENIRPTAKGLNELMRIQVNDYNFKSKPGTNETGFIAQQLYTVLPDAVSPGGANPAVEPWTVDYGRVTPLLAKAIQDQQVEIEALKAQNKNQDAALKTENAKLEAAAAKETALEREDAELKAGITEQNRRIAALDVANASLRTELTQLKAANEDLRATAAKIEALEKMMAGLQKREKNGVQIAALEKQ
jgi:hypothetical protein